MLIKICEGVHLNINSSQWTIFNSEVDTFVFPHMFPQHNIDTVDMSMTVIHSLLYYTEPLVIRTTPHWIHYAIWLWCVGDGCPPSWCSTQWHKIGLMLYSVTEWDFTGRDGQQSGSLTYILIFYCTKLLSEYLKERRLLENSRYRWKNDISVEL